ncbi:MAG: Gfo/Idh/MocA family oxidoreductase [Rhodobacteraceae bacterium]|nr:Gfo/Idh/MocA family oxidoreductase [Paracoccaceae bacterium]
MKIALVGIGKIALDQHVPALRASPDWELAATVSRHGSVDGVESWTDLDAMLAARSDIRVISLCVPPVPRFALAAKALQAGRYVMLEKPPGATLSECAALHAMAQSARLGVFATWHSREAAMVAPAKAWLSGKTVRSGRITWREDVRKWHPGQDWVFDAGGMGVFDPGINALSILTEILPFAVHLRAATLEVPQNRQMPIAAQLAFSNNISADFDWRQTGPQTWSIALETDQGTLELHDGGARMLVDGTPCNAPTDALSGEYPRLYQRMAQLVRAGDSDMDMRPLTLVADAFMTGTRVTVDPFDF